MTLATAPLVVREGHEGERLYDWKGESRPSVTSIIRYGVAKPNLVTWAGDKVLELVMSNREPQAALTDRQFKKLITKAWKEEREAAAGKGTAIHASAEQFALGKRVDMMAGTEGYIAAFDNFCYDFRPEFVMTEALVVSRTYGYAGTLDAIVIIDGKFYVLDIKTGNYIWPEVALQLSAYSRADFTGDRKTGEESPLPDLHKRGLVLHLRSDGYELRPVRLGDLEFNSFLAALDMYHWATDYSKSALLTPWVKNENG